MSTRTEKEEEEERASVAAELRAVREDARRTSGPAVATLPDPRPAPTAAALPALEAPSAEPLPPPPSTEHVNALWEALPAPAGRGPRGLITRLLRRVIDPWRQAQVAFNSRQVQLDNALVEYLDARFAATHRHYDGVLGGHGRRLRDVDERHLILQEELVAHVHDLVRRIDLVLSEGERGRLSVQHELRALRERVQALEDRLRGR